MRNILYAFLIILVSVVTIINLFSGIVGGLWLIFTGGFALVVGAIIAGFIMPWFYSLVVLPSMGLLLLTVKVIEKHIIVGTALSAIASLWEKFVTLMWVASVFGYFISQSDKFNPIPLILAAYATAMAPLQSMASHEEYANPDNGNIGTTLGLFYAQFVFLILLFSWLFSFSPTGLLWLVTLGFIAIPIYLIISSRKPFMPETPNYVQAENVIDSTTAVEDIDKREVYLTSHEDLEAAIHFASMNQQISASMLQERFGIGYAHAAVLLDEMGELGIISESTGASPRKVLANNLNKFVLNYRIHYSPKKQHQVIANRTNDELIKEAIRIVTQYERASASLLQRKLGIGYSRAARLLDQLGEIGVVSEPLEEGLRNVLVKDAERVISLISNNSTAKLPEENKVGMLIVKTLQAFGIRTRIAEVNAKKNGIEYCLDVELGSSIENLDRLEKDIALAVASPTGKVKIQAPIPGKSLVGITVPNKKG